MRIVNEVCVYRQNCKAEGHNDLGSKSERRLASLFLLVQLIFLISAHVNLDIL